MSSVWQSLRRKASEHSKRIVLADGDDPRAIEAAAIVIKQRIAEPILIGKTAAITAACKKMACSVPPFVDPAALSAPEKNALADRLHAYTKYKILTRDEAMEKLSDPLLFGCVYTAAGSADGFIGGATRTTADTIRAVFSTIGLAPRTSTLFGLFLIEPRLQTSGDAPVVILADCAVIPDPSPKQLAQIGLGAAEALSFFTGETPRVAFLSFSTAGSAEHPFVDKIRQAVAAAREKAPQLVVEGEWQADAALDSFSARIKGVGASPMAGRANVLVAPNLETGNIAYKLIQRLGGCRTVGPVLWGTARPANDLSRGCSSDDIVDMIALTSLQASRTTPPAKATSPSYSLRGEDHA